MYYKASGPYIRRECKECEADKAYEWYWGLTPQERRVAIEKIQRNIDLAQVRAKAKRKKINKMRDERKAKLIEKMRAGLSWNQYNPPQSHTQE